MRTNYIDEEYLITNPYKREIEELKFLHLTKAQREANIQPARNSATDPKVGRNEPCPCGSGNKYKRCCINKSKTDEKYKDVE